jgi:hypothetical protein
MDITKFFEPVQKFTTYLIDRVSLILITYFLIVYVTNQSILEFVKQGISYQIPPGFLESFGIKGDNQTIFVAVVALLILVAVLEIHEKVLQVLNLFSPVYFSTYSYYGEDVFAGFAPLVWRGYCRQLDLGELQNLFQLTVTKLQMESQPRTRRTEVFDFIPAWLFLMLLIFIFLPKEIVVSDFGVLKIALLLLFMGLVWEMYRGRDSGAEEYRFHYLALATLIEKKPHDFEALDDQQRKQLAERRKSIGVHSKPWSVPVLRCPWISFARNVTTYMRSRIEYRMSKGWLQNSWIAVLLRRKPQASRR